MKINPVITVIFGTVILIGLFFVFKPKTGVSETQINNALPKENSASPSAQLNSKSFELVVKKRILVSGSETLQVSEGDNVTIRITSDEAEELHLHGYDKSVGLDPNTPAELKFTANQTGRFPYELEHSKTDLGALEVLPK